MSLEARTAALEWALRAARGDLDGVDWVDSTLRTHGEPFAIVRDGDAVRFRHLGFTDTLPGPMVDAAIDAQQRGEPTALEAITQLMARAQWLTSARRFLWTAHSPMPGLLSALVESYGIDVELHGNDPDTLANLLVHLPRWFPRRGEASRAVELLDTALDRGVSARVGSAAQVAFTCQGASWWARHSRPSTLVIEGGFLRMDPVDDPEDVVLGWVPTERFPHELLRLLPASASVRLALEEDSR